MLLSIFFNWTSFSTFKISCCTSADCAVTFTHDSEMICTKKLWMANLGLLLAGSIVNRNFFKIWNLNKMVLNEFGYECSVLPILQSFNNQWKPIDTPITKILKLLRRLFVILYQEIFSHNNIDILQCNVRGVFILGLRGSGLMDIIVPKNCCISCWL